jgi:hypothetical protein
MRARTDAHQRWRREFIPTRLHAAILVIAEPMKRALADQRDQLGRRSRPRRQDRAKAIEMGADADRVGQERKIVAQPVSEGAGGGSSSDPGMSRCRDASVQIKQPGPAIGPLELRSSADEISELATVSGVNIASASAEISDASTICETSRRSGASTSRARSCASRSCHRRSDENVAAGERRRRKDMVHLIRIWPLDMAERDARET